MPKTLQAVFADGVLRPVKPLDLHEQQLVTIVILEDPDSDSLLDLEYLASCDADGEDDVSLEEVRAALAKIPGNLSEDFIAEREGR